MDLYSVADTSSLEEFRIATRPALDHLHTALGFDRWTVARKLGDDLVVVAALHRGLHSDGGEVYRWSSSVCARMSLGLGPRFVPDVARVPVYAHAPASRDGQIGAYLGIPLHDSQGSLIGSLSATHPEPVTESLADELPLVEAIARLVGANLAAQLRFSEQGRLAERALIEASTDPLTGLANRRTWEWVLAAEEERCRRFGHQATVICLDLDELKLINDTLGHEAGDELLVRAARAITGAVRAPDVVARLGGDEFAVLAVETGLAAGTVLANRIGEGLRSRGVGASLGVAAREDRVLRETWASADSAMYEAKRRSQAASGYGR